MHCWKVSPRLFFYCCVASRLSATNKVIIVYTIRFLPKTFACYPYVSVQLTFALWVVFDVSPLLWLFRVSEPNSAARLLITPPVATGLPLSPVSLTPMNRMSQRFNPSSTVMLLRALVLIMLFKHGVCVKCYKKLQTHAMIWWFWHLGMCSIGCKWVI